MKKLLRLVALGAGIAAVGYVLKERLVPIPEAPVDHAHAPRPRVAPEPTPPPPPPASPADEPQDLTAIKGIGPVFSQRLAEQGITTFAALAAADATTLAAAVDAAPAQVEEWITQAQHRTA